MTTNIYSTVGDPIADAAAIVQGENFRITVLTERLFRLEFDPTGEFEDRPSTFAWQRRFPVPEFEVRDTGEQLEIYTAKLHLTYNKAEFSTHGLSIKLRQPTTPYRSIWRFGEGQDPDNLGGTIRTLDEIDGAAELDAGINSTRGYGVIDDSASFLFTAEAWLAGRRPGTKDLYFFGYGHDYYAAVRDFYALSGPQPVLPRWALGNWWSRFHKYTDDSYLGLMSEFQDAGIPLSVAVVDMDWHLVNIDPQYGTGWTGYTWNRELFPDPEAFLAALHARGLHVTLNVHPADGVRPFEDMYQEMSRAVGVDPAGHQPIPFDAANRAFMHAYFEVLHRALSDQGVDFWWVDWQQGEHSSEPGIDPMWVLNHGHFHDTLRARGWSLVLSRYAGPGSHRYPVGFSGDTVASWDSLRFQPEFTATAANIGFGWWSHDIGGHMHGTKDDELATRWVQYGVFSPILRLHSSDNPFMTKEPWNFAEPHAAVQSEFLRLRHRLIPYLHSMNYRSHRQGVPICLPTYFNWPNNAESYRNPSQYYFGSELLVAPVTAPVDRASGSAAVKMWLPPGEWLDIFTCQVYRGNREVLLHRPLAGVPALAPAGAIIPLDGRELLPNAADNPDEIELLVVVGADGAFELMEEGTDNQIAETKISWDQAAGSLQIRKPNCQPELGKGSPEAGDTRSWRIKFLGITTDSQLVRSSHKCDLTRTDTYLELAVPNMSWDDDLEIIITPDPQLETGYKPERVAEILDRSQISYTLKWELARYLAEDLPDEVKISHILAQDLPASVQHAIVELLTA